MERIVKGIFFPIEIWQAQDLCWNEKVLLMEIDSFTCKGLDCYFSNEYIADLLKVTQVRASRLVNALIKKGYIRQTRFDGRHRYLETCIDITSSLKENDKAGLNESLRQGNSEVKGSIYMNNKQTNKPSNRERFARPSLEEVKDYCRERGNGIDAETFCDFYESKGWKVGDAPMRDWKAAVRTWEKRQRRQQSKAQVATNVEELWP